MIQLKERRYFVGLWYLQGHGQHWLGMIYKDQSAQHYVLEYQITYYKDGAEDETRSFTVPQIESKHQAISIITVMLDEMLRDGYSPRPTYEKIMFSTNKPDKVYKMIWRAAQAGKIGITLFYPWLG